MSRQVPTSDAALLALLRIAGPLSIREMAHAMDVTATAVRQRLVRLLHQNAIQRKTIRHGRGRPRDLYWLAEKGMERTGSSFADAALTLWAEVCQSTDPALRQATLRRMARALVSGDADKIKGKTPAEQKKSLAKLLNRQQVPVSEEAVNQSVRR